MPKPKGSNTLRERQARIGQLAKDNKKAEEELVALHVKNA